MIQCPMAYDPDDLLTFTAIDFETANYRQASACALGIVRVEGGEIVSVEEHYIRPEPLEIPENFIRIHGITPERVRSEPQFWELWEKFNLPGEATFIAAHNVPFDMGVLGASLDMAGIPRPRLLTLDSLKVAKKAWPEITRRNLAALSAYLEIELDHHNAASDARACALILLRAFRKWGFSLTGDLKKKGLQLSPWPLQPELTQVKAKR